mgnify:CR=1 FL=1
MRKNKGQIIICPLLIGLKQLKLEGKMNNLMRYRGEPVEVRDRYGRVHRGIIDGMDPSRAMIIRTPFGRRRIPFFLILAIFAIRRRRRIF